MLLRFGRFARIDWAMDNLTETVTHTFVTEECYSCSTVWAMPTQFVTNRRNDHRDFYCPNGHAQRYYGKSQAEKLKDRLAAEQARHDQTRAELADQKRAHAATKGQLTKVRRRVAAGVCPCCKRSFRQLRAHMKRMHPEYPDDK